ncbi:MAG: hypothetical protein CSB21_01980 [Deltaproteobacteria bacterium]|nr:MAG: hypothetical protein CSB21_01980 [Deltaproteobacteria bacterium]
MSGNVNTEEFIKELHFCIKENDLVKLKALIQFFPELPEKNKIRVLFEISMAPDELAFPALIHLLKFELTQESVKKKLYYLLVDRFFNHQELINDYLLDPELKNKILLIQVAGELQISQSLPVLNEILIQETDISVLAAVIGALANINDSSSIRKVADFLYYGHEGLKIEAVKALCKMGGPSSVNLLGEAVTGETESDFFIIDQLAEIQDQYALNMLIQLLNSHCTPVRNRAIDKLVEIGSKAVPAVIENLKCEDDDSIIMTLNVLGSIGDKSAIKPVSKLLFKNPKNANIRFAAYEALEKLPSEKAAIRLAAGLEDPEKQVRIAAARAIDKNISPVLVSGIKNMISQIDESSKDIVATIIDSGADRTFEYLINSQIFSNLAVIHLAKEAHPDTREHFTNLLSAAGHDDIVEKIMIATDLKSDKKLLTVFAVDDSKMMLRIYKQKLHQMGYVPVIFEFPEKALEALENEKPDLLITDLNMPSMNGIELVKRTRKKYDEKKLPVIMITTQSDFIGQSSKNKFDAKNIKEMGIARIINKPFNDEELKKALDALLKK